MMQYEPKRTDKKGGQTMETKEHRKERVKTILDAGIKAFNEYMSVPLDQLDEKTCIDAYRYMELEDKYGDNGFTQICEMYSKYFPSEATEDYELAEEPIEILKALNSIELADEDAIFLKLLEEDKKELAKLLPSFNRWQDAVIRQVTETNLITAEAMEKYTDYLKGIKESKRKNYLLLDLQTALDLIKGDNNYLEQLKKDTEKTKVTPLIEVTLGSRVTEQGELYTKIYNALTIYLYVFIRNFRVMTIYENQEEHNKADKLLMNYTKSYLEAITKTKVEIPQEPIVRNVLSEFAYPLPTNSFTRALTGVVGAKPSNDKMGLNYVKETECYKIIRTKLDSKNIVKSYGVPTDKILGVILGEFIRNNTRIKNPAEGLMINTHVSIDLYDYADKTGYSLKEEVKDNAKDQEKEHKRVLGRKKEFKKNIEANLENLSREYINYENKKEKKKGGFIVLDSYEVNGRTNTIDVWLGQKISVEILSSEHTQLTQQYNCLLKIDNKNPTAYQIAKKMSAHYNMDKNIKAGRNKIISIKSLLSETSIPTAEQLKSIKKYSQWGERIKAPLENALNYLHSQSAGVCFLKDYRYSHAKGVELTEEELIEIEGNDCLASFEKWQSYYIYFEINEPKEASRQSVLEAKKQTLESKKTDKKSGKARGSIKKKNQNNPKTQGKEKRQ